MLSECKMKYKIKTNIQAKKKQNNNNKLTNPSEKKHANCTGPIPKVFYLSIAVNINSNLHGSCLNSLPVLNVSRTRVCFIFPNKPTN